MEYSLRAPDLPQTEPAFLTTVMRTSSGWTNICHVARDVSLSKCFPEVGELTNSIVVSTQPEPMFFTLVSRFNILVQY